MVETVHHYSGERLAPEAIDALNQGHSVVVSAPTGSGKTLVGEYAIHRALAHGQKVFYTT
ncbi:MAG: DEAD/DEAH box helicase, partial [Vulcanococcus sp.]